MLLADATTAVTGGSNNAAQIIAAAGTALSLVIGALVLWPTRRRRDRVAAAIEADPEDRPARLRERIARLETRMDVHDERLEHVDEQLGLLRALQSAVEALTHPVRRGGSRGE